MRLLKIGRDSGCDIVLGSNNVSSIHAEITILNSGDYMLEDKGSSNGTFVMGQRIKPGKPVKIRRGDRIQFADAELQWSQIPMPEDNSAYKAIFGIGSHFSNEIQVSGATVSRYHATIKVGKDGKVYIVDHSKNGTTVNGAKITPNNPYRITKKSSIACGGVPVNLKNNPVIGGFWGTDILKWIASIAAVLAIVAAVIVGIIFMPRTWDPKKINARYSNTTVLLMGMYHFEVECGDLDLSELNKRGIPTKFYFTNDGLLPCGEETKSSAVANKSHYEASGFFISKDGKILTNLHVVKPWLFDNLLETVESYCRNKFARSIEVETGTMLLTRRVAGLSGYVSQLKVKGVSDGILMMPQQTYFSSESTMQCHVLSAGEDIKKDVALIQVDNWKNLNVTYVNVQDSIDVNDSAFEVGENMFTIGFPHGTSLQNIESDKGLQAFTHSGHITNNNDEYGFKFDATSYHGASGSPVFNDHGMLIGILDSGVEKENINGAIKAKFIKELLDSPYKK